MGDEETLARGMKAVFDKVEETRDADPAAANAEEVENMQDTTRIAEKILLLTFFIFFNLLLQATRPGSPVASIS